MKAIIVILALIVVIALVWLGGAQHGDCKYRGGVFVRTPVWFACVQPLKEPT